MRKALSRCDKVPNVDQSKTVIESTVMNMARAYQRASNVAKGAPFEFSENMQYFFMYALGILKSPLIHVPMVMNQIDTVDRVVY